MSGGGKVRVIGEGEWGEGVVSGRGKVGVIGEGGKVRRMKGVIEAGSKDMEWGRVGIM